MSTSLDKLRQAMESASPSQGEKKSYDDDKYWKSKDLLFISGFLIFFKTIRFFIICFYWNFSLHKI